MKAPVDCKISNIMDSLFSSIIRSTIQIHIAGNTEELFDLLNKSDFEKLPLKKALTKDIFEELKFKTTTMGGTLGDCIRSGNFQKTLIKNVMNVQGMSQV